jgi:hypothetical protein
LRCVRQTSILADAVIKASRVKVRQNCQREIPHMFSVNQPATSLIPLKSMSFRNGVLDFSLTNESTRTQTTTDHISLGSSDTLGSKYSSSTSSTSTAEEVGIISECRQQHRQAYTRALNRLFQKAMNNTHNSHVRSTCSSSLDKHVHVT